MLLRTIFELGLYSVYAIDGFTASYADILSTDYLEILPLKNIYLVCLLYFSNFKLSVLSVITFICLYEGLFKVK